MSDSQAERTEIIDALTTSMRQTMVETVLLFELLAQRIGINATDMQCLNILDFEGLVPAGRLAEFTGLTTGAITITFVHSDSENWLYQSRIDWDEPAGKEVAMLS